MGLAFGPVCLVISLRPRTHLPAAIGPQMDGVSEVPVTMPPDLGPPDLPARKTHRGRPRHALQIPSRGILAPVRTQLAQQPRGQLSTDARQTPEDGVIRMLGKPLFNLRPIRG